MDQKHILIPFNGREMAGFISINWIKNIREWWNLRNRENMGDSKPQMLILGISTLATKSFEPKFNHVDWKCKEK